VSGPGLCSRDDVLNVKVHVWRLPLERAPATVAAWLAELSVEEQARAARFRQPADVARFVLGRRALRRILAARLGCAPAAVPLITGPNGKPLLAAGQAPWHFNLSHSGDWVLLVLAWERRVGIDVEAWRELEFAALAERAFAPEERAALLDASEAEQAATFFAIWTRKEALLKARGLGLGAFPLEDFAVEADPAVPRPRVLRWRGEEEPGRTWSLFTLPVAGRCSACVAVEGRDQNAVISVALDEP